ncbi:putative transmembrane protein [Candidatus Burkholderia verschuerenii]|uniref:Putative transmembrane protein n=2 Tax=Candidatus Burkholderia verschuerenii TaxID=242163 RepID=A0A0L0MIC9_9BURK|nr:putative transmembrane protein [Candidatus Burkholderia verschuerenii]
MMSEKEFPLEKALNRFEMKKGVTTFGSEGRDREELVHLPSRRPNGVTEAEWRALQASDIDVEGTASSAFFTLLPIDGEKSRALGILAYTGGTGLFSYRYMLAQRAGRFVTVTSSRLSPSVSGTDDSWDTALYSINDRGANQSAYWVRLRGRVYAAYVVSYYGEDNVYLLRPLSIVGKVPKLTIRYAYHLSVPHIQKRDEAKTAITIDNRLHAQLEEVVHRLSASGARDQKVKPVSCPVLPGVKDEERERYSDYGPGHYTIRNRRRYERAGRRQMLPRETGGLVRRVSGRNRLVRGDLDPLSRRRRRGTDLQRCRPAHSNSGQRQDRRRRRRQRDIVPWPFILRTVLPDTLRTAMHTILVIGGYGFFGNRICHDLATKEGIRVLIGGRDAARAKVTAERIGLPASHDVAVDARAPDLAPSFIEMGVNTVIHTAGPFQGQDYGVARSAIAAGANYIDLADGRDFVAGIESLDAAARERGVFVTSGASSLPALSSAIVDRYLGRFSRLDSIRHGIGSGARSPGLATMKGVFGYCGKPFQRLVDGSWQGTHGWLDIQCYSFRAPVGKRFLSSCDVPDLILFPRRYPAVRTVTFHAGFAGAPGHLVVWAASQLVRMKLAPSIRPLAAPLHAVSRWLEPFVSDKGAMFVSLEGIGLDGKPLKLDWHLVASNNHGPHIPCGAAIALGRKLARGDALPHGATPCVGLLSVEDYLFAGL